MKIRFTLALIFASIVNSFAANHLIEFGGSVGMAYSPNLVLVTTGDTVTWQGDFGFHPLEATTIPSGAAPINVISGSTFSYVVTVAGDYFFHCSVHLFSGQIKASNPTTGLSQIKSVKEISIYPTVSKTILKIDVPLSVNKYSVEIRNAVGQVTLQTDLSSNSINTIDVSPFYDGLYFVAVSKEGEIVKVVRLIKE